MFAETKSFPMHENFMIFNDGQRFHSVFLDEGFLSAFYDFHVISKRKFFENNLSTELVFFSAAPQ